MTKHLLSKFQRSKGMYTVEDDHLVTVYNAEHKVLAVFSAQGATIKEIQEVKDVH